MSTALAAPMPASPVVVYPSQHTSAQDDTVTMSDTLCACGCGQPTPLAKMTDRRYGHVKGEPVKYIVGHSARAAAMALKQQETAALAIPPERGMREITPEVLEHLRGIDDLDAATMLDDRLRMLVEFDKRSFAEKGLITAEVEQRRSWARLTDPQTGVYFHSFDAWMSSAGGASRSSLYDALGTFKSLRAVPVADVLEMPRCNAKQMQHLSTAVQRDPKVIEAAKNMEGKQFTQFVQKHHPEQHAEVRKPMQLKPSASARTSIDLAVEAAMFVYGVTSREEALEAITASWLDSPCEMEGHDQQTNRLAHAQAIGKHRRTA